MKRIMIVLGLAAYLISASMVYAEEPIAWVPSVIVDETGQFDLAEWGYRWDIPMEQSVDVFVHIVRPGYATVAWEFANHGITRSMGLGWHKMAITDSDGITIICLKRTEPVFNQPMADGAMIDRVVISQPGAFSPPIETPEPAPQHTLWVPVLF